MPRISDTKRKILDRATDLLQENGYNGFSYADISSTLGIKNAAIHYHFPSKEDLGLAVVQRERRRFNKWINRRELTSQKAWGRLEWFFMIYTHYLDNGRKVCIPGTLAADLASMSKTIRDETEGLVTDMLTWLTEVLAEGREDGLVKFEGKPEDKALVVMASTQGALQIARIAGEKQFKAIIKTIKQDLQT